MTSSDIAIAMTQHHGLILDPLAMESPPSETRQRLLRFPLSDQESVLIPLEQITEVLRLEPTEILPVPDMMACTLGISNWRGYMLWLVDFNSLIGYPPYGQILRRTLVMAIVVQIHEVAVGLVVPQVSDIELHDLQQLQPALPGVLPPQFLPYVLGVLPGRSNVVLDVHAIMQSPLWQNHPAPTV